MDSIADRLDLARKAFARAISAKDRRDVSVEVTAVVNHLTEAQATFRDIETNEYVVRAALGQGLQAELHRLLATTSDVPRPNMALRKGKVEALLARVDAASALIDNKIDKDAADAISANDPFIRAMENGEQTTGGSTIAEIFDGIDICKLIDEAPEPGEVSDDNDPIVTTSTVSFYPGDLPNEEKSGVFLSSAYPPALPTDGPTEAEFERTWLNVVG